MTQRQGRALQRADSALASGANHLTGAARVISFSPLANNLRRKVGRPAPDVILRAAERWEIAPGGIVEVPPAIMLPGQIERIIGTEFGSLEQTLFALRNEGDGRVDATTACLLRDVDLVDGVLYLGGAERHLRARRHPRALHHRRPETELSGAMYESWVGNRWFGNWLMDNCLTYPLAAALGTPVTTAPRSKGHAPRYEDLLGMAPLRIGDVHFRELILIDDLPNNAAKFARAAAMRERLLGGRQPVPHPGVFLLRGRTGDVRLLSNEDEIAARLAAERGFRILDPMTMTVDDLIEASAGARVVAGVEGSQLVHGQIVAPAGSTLLTIQPPDRVTAAMKLMTDRLGQRFGLIVAEGDMNRFRVDWSDVARTLDLLD